MASKAPSSGDWLDGWLARLAEQGWVLGTREHLRVQALLAGLAASGELPAEPATMLALAGPVLCGTREQQRQYARLLQAYVAERLRARAAGSAPAGASPEAQARLAESDAEALRLRLRRQRVVLGGAAGLVLAGALLVAALIDGRRPDPIQTDSASPSAAATRAKPQADRASGARASALPAGEAPAAATAWEVLPQPLPEPILRTPAWSLPLRALLVALGLMSALLLAAALWRRRQQQMALQGQRTDARVQHHLLFDPAPVSVAPHPVLANSVGRSLRQRMAGEAQVLDVPGTLAATLRAQGALSPRWRALQRMPEYLVLIDRRHAADHQAAYAEALADALFRAGVPLQVFHFDGSPATGCWARGALGNADPLTRRSVSLGELAARSQPSRLLVFGTADAVINPATGETESWVGALKAFGGRAWFTTRPMADWGAAEDAADAAGFLLLPLQEASLQTLAGWLTAGRLTLALDPDTPGALPPDLRHAGLNWVTQIDPPPAEVQERLLRDLRRWLGGTRFQWLCACAIFPAVTPPLTLALGRHVVGEGRALALGLSALSALPWFRWGRMPAWLREALLDRLSATHREQLQAVVQQRLAGALGQGSGPAMADVATRVNAWLRQGSGVAQDVVLAEYLQKKDAVSRLAQRLPDALRRRLFRGGRVGRGVQAWVLGGPAALVAVACLALTPVWDVLWQPAAESALPLSHLARVPNAPRAAVAGIDFVGESGVRVRYADGAQLAGNFSMGRDQVEFLVFPAVGGDRVKLNIDEFARPGATVTPDGRARVELDPAGGGVFLRYVRPAGEVTVALRATPRPGQGGASQPANPGGPSRALSAVFTPSGSRVLAVLSDGSVAIWGRPAIDFQVLECADPYATTWLSPDALKDSATGASARAGRPAIEFTRMDRRTAQALRRASAAEVDAGAAVRPGVLLLGRQADAAARLAVVDAALALAASAGVSPPALTEATSLLPAGSDALQDLDDTVLADACAISSRTKPLAPIYKPPTADESIAGLTPAQQKALSRQLDRVFGADLLDGAAATRELLNDGALFSDAVTLAVRRSLRSIPAAGGLMAAFQATGFTYTLRLIGAAQPATLNRLRLDIETLLKRSRAGGAEALQQVEAVSARLRAATEKRPVLFVQIADERQRAPVQSLLASLGDRLSVAPPALRPKEAPARPELRIVGLSDRALARSLSEGKGLALVGIRPTAKTPADNDVYEVWLDAGWCISRAAPACPQPNSPLESTPAVPLAEAASRSNTARPDATSAAPQAVRQPGPLPTVANPGPLTSAPSPLPVAEASKPTAASDFVAEVRACPASGATQGANARPALGAVPLAQRVQGVLSGMGLTARLSPDPFEGGSKVPPGTAWVLGYPAHAAVVEDIANRLRKEGLRVETTLTDIGAVIPSEATRQAQSSGYKIIGLESRVLVAVCEGR